MQSVGFKEWALVCEALGAGKQSVLLRKGGIAEGRDGFGFRHSEFFLFPTFFHEQVLKVREPGAVIPTAPQGEIEIQFFAKLEAQQRITSWETAAHLEPFHILDDSVVRNRFEYESAGLHVAVARVFRLEPAWVFQDLPAYGGCRSWVKLPQFPTETRLDPVLSDKAHEEVVRSIEAVLSCSDGATT
jgi:hypothetical protein